MDHYYLANNFWINFNLFAILPFIIACINRYRNPDINTYLFTDHLSRWGMAITCLFYIYDSVVKYMVDGGQTICQKALLIHHISSEFIITPLFINSYIPWWANPIGFLHGFLVYFPDFEMLNYLYAGVLIYFQYNLYQKDFKDFPYYAVTRFAINGIWSFVIFLLIGGCSNYLPVGPD